MRVRETHRTSLAGEQGEHGVKNVRLIFGSERKKKVKMSKMINKYGMINKYDQYIIKALFLKMGVSTGIPNYWYRIKQHICIYLFLAK